MTEGTPYSGSVQTNLRELYTQYKSGVVPVVTIDSHGDEHIGSAFHIGEGVFVTAAHIGADTGNCTVYDESIVLLPHPQPAQDVAVFTAPRLANLPALPLGEHLDDWIDDDAFMLNHVLVLGYPPIPLAKKAVLVAAVGQVNAVVDLINVRHVHFIVSVMARGGFSGGVVLSEWNFVLGVITSSLVRNSAPEENGYLTVLTVEPILECLAANGLLTAELSEIWGDLFDGTDSSLPPQSVSNVSFDNQDDLTIWVDPASPINDSEDLM